MDGILHTLQIICIIDHCSFVIFLQLINFSNCVSPPSDSPSSFSLVASSLRHIRFCTWLTHFCYSIKIFHKVPLHYAESKFLHLHQTEELNISYIILSNQATLNVQSSLDFHTTRSILINGITLFITFVSFKPKVIFWMSLVDSTVFRFTTNAACLLFVDSIRELVKFSPITVSQILQYNTTFTHNLFLSVIEVLTHFLEQKLKIVSFKKLQKKLVWTRMNSSLSLLHQLGWLIFFFTAVFSGRLIPLSIFYLFFIICTFFFLFVETYLAFGACHLIQCAFSKHWIFARKFLKDL